MPIHSNLFLTTMHYTVYCSHLVINLVSHEASSIPTDSNRHIYTIPLILLPARVKVTNGDGGVVEQPLVSPLPPEVGVGVTSRTGVVNKLVCSLSTYTLS